MNRAWRVVGGGLAACIGVLLGVATMAPAAEPEWVDRAGLSHAHPQDRFVTGYGHARGKNAEARARQAALAALAEAVEVRVEFELRDQRQETHGRYAERIAAVTRTSSDLQLRDLRFEVYRGHRRVHALAILERRPAASLRRRLRDRELVRVEACLADAELARETGDRHAYESRIDVCRTAHATALAHDAVAIALVGPETDDQAADRLTTSLQALDRADAATDRAPIDSLADAADLLAERLRDQGLGPARRIDVPAFTFAATNVTSAFGRAAAHELERALAETWADSGKSGLDLRRLTVRGAYVEEGDQVRLTVVVRGFGRGSLVASATAVFPREAVPTGLTLRPANWAPAMAQRRALEIDPDTAPPMRVELWTDRGRNAVSYAEGEFIRLFVRVSEPAWLQLVYVLPNGLAVPVDHGFRVEAGQTRTAIPYPSHFEVVAPFGVEMIHASAFARKPEPLPTRLTSVDGVEYEVVDHGIATLTRARGIRRVQGGVVAEDVVTITTVSAEEAGLAELRPRRAW